MNENFGSITGNILAVLTAEDGSIKQELEFKNLVVTSGKRLVASRLIGTADNSISNLAIGSGTSSPAITDGGLQTELARVAIGSATSSGAVVTYTASFGPGVGTGNINECGLFNSPTVGASNSMLARSNSLILTKGASDTLALTWTVTFN